MIKKMLIWLSSYENPIYSIQDIAMGTYTDICKVMS